MPTIIKYIFGLFAIITIASCKKFVAVPPPVNGVVSSEVFVSDAKATSVVTSIYGDMINGSPSFANFLTTKFLGYSSDELQKFNPPADENEFIQNSISTTNGWTSNIWRSIYNKIYNANAAIEGIENSSGISSTVKDELIGECKFIRALCNFYLVNIYGDAPIITSTDYNQTAFLSRSPASAIYDLIFSDLSDAKTLLGTAYIGNEKARPNKWAVTALLARCYLYKKDWAKAEAAASELINSGIFTPLQDPSIVFLKNSKEAIWQLMPKSGVLKEINEMKPVGSTATPLIILSPQLLSAFESGDKRRMNWVDSFTYVGTKYFFPAKYRNITSSSVTEYYMVLRIAEQYLIRAEARCRQNDLVNAIADINVIRTRAGLSSLPSSLTSDQVLAAIEQERRIEFFAEWGHRWLDLKRTDRANIVLGALKSDWQPTDQLYPIPQDDILKNPNLTQNPGY